MVAYRRYPQDAEFTALGYGTLEEVATRLPAGRWVVIRDDDDATAGMPPAWFATDTDSRAARRLYAAEGGTVSAVNVVYVAEDGTVKTLEEVARAADARRE